VLLYALIEKIRRESERDWFSLQTKPQTDRRTDGHDKDRHDWKHNFQQIIVTEKKMRAVYLNLYKPKF